MPEERQDRPVHILSAVFGDHRGAEYDASRCARINASVPLAPSSVLVQTLGEGRGSMSSQIPPQPPHPKPGNGGSATLHVTLRRLDRPNGKVKAIRWRRRIASRHSRCKQPTTARGAAGIALGSFRFYSGICHCRQPADVRMRGCTRFSCRVHLTSADQGKEGRGPCRRTWSIFHEQRFHTCNNLLHPATRTYDKASSAQSFDLSFSTCTNSRISAVKSSGTS